MKTLRTLGRKSINGKVCLLRLDLNVIERNPREIYRFRASLPTLKFLLARGAKVVIVSHRGRPKKADGALSLRPFAEAFACELNKNVAFFPHPKAGKRSFDAHFSRLRWEIATSPKKLFLLENIRFFPGEEKNDANLARALASLADIYVNDAFAVSHRRNASVCAVAKLLPSYAGLLLERELSSLGKATRNPRRPFVILAGGAKVKEKMELMRIFRRKADLFLLSGAVANTFFAAQGENIGSSTHEKEFFKEAKRFASSEKVYLPLDDLRHKGKILDIGPVTADEYARIVLGAKTVLFAGPPGYYHEKRFAGGTKKMWSAIIERTKDKSAFAVAGGGETVASLALVGETPDSLARKRKNIFISTGGGAMIEFLAGKKLPGVEALK